MSAQQTNFDDLAPRSLKDMQRLASLKDTGERDAKVANVFFVLTGVGVAATAILVYLDLRRTRSAERAAAKEPTVIVGAGSVQLQLAF